MLTPHSCFSLVILSLAHFAYTQQQPCCVQHLDVSITSDHYGFHRLVTFNATIHYQTTNQHKQLCTIRVSQLLPQGMYADPYQLRSTASLTLDVDGTFDSESLATQAHPMLLRMTAAAGQGNTHVLWRVPIHMRYDAPQLPPGSTNSMRSSVVLPPAVTADTCSSRVAPGPPVRVSVPVGDMGVTTAVVGLSTAAAMSGALFVVLRVTFGL